MEVEYKLTATVDGEEVYQCSTGLAEVIESSLEAANKAVNKAREQNDE